MRWNKPALYLVVAALLCCALPLLRATVRNQPKTTTPQVKPGPQQPPPLPLRPPGPAAQKLRNEPFVLIDPAHGGKDKGVVFSARLSEKDVTLALGRELRKELVERGIPVKMLRDTDVNVDLDLRAEIANQPHTAFYVALHAGRPGSGVRVYAPLLASTQPAAGRFLPWESAQSTSLERSRKLAQAVAREMRKRNVRVALLDSPLRPLNNVVPPAIAVELAAGPDKLRSLESEKTQTEVAAAIAAAIAQKRATAGGHP